LLQSGAAGQRRSSALAALVTPLMQPLLQLHLVITNEIGEQSVPPTPASVRKKRKRMGSGTDAGWRTILCNNRIS
jgi:hypothetical protein